MNVLQNLSEIRIFLNFFVKLLVRWNNLMVEYVVHVRNLSKIVGVEAELHMDYRLRIL